jgi:hypothetical protein
MTTHVPNIAMYLYNDRCVGHEKVAGTPFTLGTDWTALKVNQLIAYR